MRLIYCLITASVVGLLAACGGGGGSAGAASGGSSGGGSSGGGGAPAAPTVSLEIRNSASTVTTTVSALDIFTARATVRDSAGAVAAGQVVTFGGDSAFVKFSPAIGTALTDANGVATVQLSPGSAASAGASSITANVTVTGTPATQATLGLQVLPLASGGTASIALQMLSPASVATNTVAALDSNILRATVRDSLGNVLPAQVVTFSSASGLVRLSPAASALTDLFGVATVNVTRSLPTSAGAEVLGAAATVAGIAVTPATLNVNVSALVNGGVPTISLGLRDINNISTTTVARGTTSFAHVQLLDATGVAPTPTLVTLTGDASLIAFSATGLTDNTGVARIPITVVPASAGGASTLRASATVSAAPLSASIDFQVPAGANAGVPTLTLGLGGGGNSVSASGLTLARATVTDASGAAVVGRLVTFTGNAALIKFSPASGQVLTDASGVASIQVAPASLSAEGASTLVANTSVGATALTTSFDFQLAAANLGLQTLNLGAGSLAAFGNRPISVVATVNGAPATNIPVQVTFSASCGTVAPATVTTDATGTASTTYSASLATCAGTNVTITAAAEGAAVVSGTVAVANSVATNVQFVSTAPDLIYLKDSVGPTQALLTFKVVDSSGNPLQNKGVSLSLSNAATGVSLNAVGNTAPVVLTTDSAGLVVASVFSGTVPTSLSVRATLVDNASIFTNSNQLTVAVGRPTQRSLSLATENVSIEGGSLDGVETSVTLSMADRQGNPVPPGTQVNFVTEAGVMLPPVCFVASNSSCSVTLRSQGTRTANGLVSIMAYVTGEEDFVDVNGNNVFDAGDTFTDLGRAFRDDNGASLAGANGIYNTGEFQVPRDGVPACTQAGQCPGDGVWGVADVRARSTVVFASSNAVITTSSLVANVPFAGSTPATNTLTAVTVTVADVNANSMATGSTIVISAIDDGLQVPGYATGASCILRSTASHTVGNTVSPTVVGVTLVACTAGDQFRVVVTSPSGFTTERFFTVQ